MRIKTKLLIAPFITTIIFIIGGIIIFQNLQSVIFANQAHNIEMNEMMAISKLPRDLDRIRWSIGGVLLGESSVNILNENWQYYTDDSANLEMILSRPKDTLDDDDAKPALVSEKNSLAIFQTVETDTQALKKKSDDIITAYDNGDLDSAKRKYEEIDGLFSGFSVTFEDMMTDNMGEIDSIMKTVDTVQEVAQKWIMVLFGAIVLLELMFSLLNSSIIARELSDVQNVVEKVLKGDLKKRIKITAKDEVGDLARAFNQMIAKLQESYASLEKKVKIRTKELEESRVGVEKEVQARTKELDKTVDVLERTTSVMTDRELKMIELKKRIKELEEKNALLANKK